jgi:hypothetical protein
VKLVNLQLRLAITLAGLAEDEWKAHRMHCPRCADAQHRRRPAEMCRAGSRLYDSRSECLADLARERRLARLPAPGQEQLFSDDALRNE